MNTAVSVRLDTPGAKLKESAYVLGKNRVITNSIDPDFLVTSDTVTRMGLVAKTLPGNVYILADPISLNIVVMFTRGLFLKSFTTNSKGKE